MLLSQIKLGFCFEQIQLLKEKPLQKRNVADKVIKTYVKISETEDYRLSNKSFQLDLKLNINIHFFK